MFSLSWIKSPGAKNMDSDKIINFVFEKTKRKIGADDPIFALVAMNEAVLDEYLARATEEIQIAAREIELQTGANIAKVSEIESRIDAIRKDVSEYIREKTRLSVEAAKLDLKNVAAEAVRETATRIAQEANAYIARTIDAQLYDHIAKVKKAENDLLTKIDGTKVRYSELTAALEHATDRANSIKVSNAYTVAIWCFCGGIFGALTVVIIISKLRNFFGL
jgi:regulator of replication initiation timing